MLDLGVSFTSLLPPICCTILALHPLPLATVRPATVAIPAPFPLLFDLNVFHPVKGHDIADDCCRMQREPKIVWILFGIEFEYMGSGSFARLISELQHGRESVYIHVCVCVYSI